MTGHNLKPEDLAEIFNTGKRFVLEILEQQKSISKEII